MRSPERGVRRGERIQLNSVRRYSRGWDRFHGLGWDWGSDVEGKGDFGGI